MTTDDKLIDTVMELIVEDDGGGICTACHNVAYGVEPDAEGYGQCDACGALRGLV
tara:strand:+ start:166 stop:330 length:165 start_codon:yes stop_codon:yes gene_type:complete